MTQRELQIKRAAHNYINSDAVQAGNEQLAFGDFINGCKWADEHPDLYSVTRKAIETERKHLIDKAIEYINGFLTYSTLIEYQVSKEQHDEVTKDFRKFLSGEENDKDEDEKINILNTALNTYGIRQQQWMLVEECGELLNVIAKSKRDRVGKNEIITELADVSIMIDQMALFYGLEDFKDEREKKLQRLKERLIKHKKMSANPFQNINQKELEEIQQTLEELSNAHISLDPERIKKARENFGKVFGQ